MNTKSILLIFSIVFSLLGLSAAGAQQHSPAGATLVAALRQGGFVVYFRHAATDWSQRDNVAAENDWWSCDTTKMRQLTDEGRRDARKIGAAIRQLGIPVGSVYASEYCRARETAEQFHLGEVIPSREIMNMRAAPFLGGRQAVVDRARKALRSSPKAGTNTVWVAHGNIIRAATGEYPGEAGCVIFEVSPDGSLQTVGRLGAEDWEILARQYGRPLHSDADTGGS